MKKDAYKKRLGLEYLNINIKLLNDYKKGKDVAIIDEFNPFHKSIYILGVGICIILIACLGLVINLRFNIPFIYIKITFISGIVLLIISLILKILALKRCTIPYINLGNILKKIVYNPEKKLISLTKKLVANNKYVTYSLLFKDDEKVQAKINEYYKCLDLVYLPDNEDLKNFIIENGKDKRNLQELRK